MKCLTEGFFSLSTVKKLERIYDREKEKRRISLDIKTGCLVFVSGLRRVGKTTLVRSISNSMKDRITIYINFWDETLKTIDELKNTIAKKFIMKLESSKSVLSKIGAKISEAEILIGPLKFKFDKRRIEDPMLILESIFDKGAELVIIMDEIQESEMDKNKLAKFISALKDRFSPKLSIFVMGSVSSVRDFIESSKGKRIEDETIYGRIDDELIIEPFDEITAERFLIAGFNECGVEISDDDIRYAVSMLGGFPGWLVKLGHYYVRMISLGRKISIKEAVSKVEIEARAQIFREIARAIEGKRNPRTYLRVLKFIANVGSSGPSRLSRELSLGTKQNALKYLKWLTKIGLLKHIDDEYIIPDPVIRRLALMSSFEREVLKRLRR